MKNVGHRNGGHSIIVLKHIMVIRVTRPLYQVTDGYTRSMAVLGLVSYVLMDNATRKKS